MNLKSVAFDVGWEQKDGNPRPMIGYLVVVVVRLAISLMNEKLSGA